MPVGGKNAYLEGLGLYYSGNEHVYKMYKIYPLGNDLKRLKVNIDGTAPLQLRYPPCLEGTTPISTSFSPTSRVEMPSYRGFR